VDKWAPTIVTAAIAMLGWAVMYGTFIGSIRALTKALDAHLKAYRTEQDNQWTKINDNDSELAHLKGFMEGQKAKAARGGVQ
jgi:hypothetical protein